MTLHEITIMNCSLNQLAVAVELMQKYLTFYRRKLSDDQVTAFVKARITKQDSAIFLALDQGQQAVGIAQLYPFFSTLSLSRVWVLNDLFVVESARMQGIATKLIHHCAAFAKAQGATRLDLKTEHTNTEAKKLYEKLGFVADQAFQAYSLQLT